jgi:hypothetical protein
LGFLARESLCIIGTALSKRNAKYEECCRVMNLEYFPVPKWILREKVLALMTDVYCKEIRDFGNL